MQGIEFEDDRSNQGSTVTDRGNRNSRPSAMMRLLFKIGVSDPSAANYILLGIAVLFFGITIFMYADILSGGPKKDPSLDARAALEMLRNSQRQ